MNQSIIGKTTIGECALAAIGSYFVKWVNQEEPAREDKDPENLHQMRLGLRRLRSAINCFNPILGENLSNLSKRLGKIAQPLGKVRDLDVLKQELQSNYFPLLPVQEQAQLGRCFRVWDKQRKKYFAEMIELFDSSFYQSTKHTIEDWLNNPQFKENADFTAPEVIPTLLLPIAGKLLLHPGWLLEYDAADSWKHGEELHSLRKQFKQARYQLESLQEFYSPELMRNVRHLQSAQDVLGFIQDRMVLTGAISKKRSERLPMLFQIIGEHQLEDWQTWQNLQRTYLSPDFRHSLFEMLLTPKI